MKLVELLNITDELSTIVVWGISDNSMPLFDGIVHDVPWKTASLEITKGLEHCQCGISIRQSENHNAIMVVSVNDTDEAMEEISFDF